MPDRTYQLLGVGNVVLATIKVPDNGDHTLVGLREVGAEEDMLGLDFEPNGGVTVGHWPEGEEWIEALRIEDFGHENVIAHPLDTDDDGRPLYWDGERWGTFEHAQVYAHTGVQVEGLDDMGYWVDRCHGDT